MALKTKILLVGKGGSGKNFLADAFLATGNYSLSISDTTRPPRINEENSIHYYFVSEEEFESNKEKGVYFETMEFKGFKYATRYSEFNKNLFIVNQNFLNSLSYEQRCECFVVYLDIPIEERRNRLTKRNDVNDTVERRIESDEIDFKGFVNYDFKITNPNFNVKAMIHKIELNAKMPSIWLDIDGVVADFEQYFLSYLNIKDKSHPENWEDEKFKSNFHKIEFDENFWLSIPPIKDATLNSLQFVRGFCTARSISSSVSEKWLLEKLNLCDKPVITVGFDNSKVEALKKVGCDIFIDDSIHNYIELNRNGVLTYLKTRPHNQNIRGINKRLEVINEFLKENLSTNFDM